MDEIETRSIGRPTSRKITPVLYRHFFLLLFNISLDVIRKLSINQMYEDKTYLSILPIARSLICIDIF